MNQILETKSNKKNSYLIKLNKTLKFQLYFFLILILIIVTSILYNTFKLYKQEQYSNKILNNYNITKLYSNLSSYDVQNSNKFSKNYYIIGIIEIPKINIYYPIFSICDENLLKISPCKFYGPEPGEIGNLCIAGHNYDNNKFFSKISHLNTNDEIIIYNNSSKKFSYFVLNIYEVKPNDLSPIYSYDNHSNQLTLITCNNLNKNRIIVKALYK